MQSHSKLLQASVLVALSGVLYGFLGYLGTGIVKENISISTMLFWRFLIAGCCMLCFIKQHHSQLRLNKNLIFMFLLGAIGYAGTSGFYFIASEYTGTGLAMVLFFSYPNIIALFSWIVYRQEFKVGTFLMLIAMMIGLIFLHGSSTHPLNMIGIIFGIFSAMCYAFYMLGSKQMSVTMDSNILTTIVCFGCASIFFIGSLLTHSFVVPHTMHSWIYLIALGILATALPIQLMLNGLKYISSMRAAILSVLEPLVTVFLGVLLLNESVSHLQMLGAFIILTSAILVQFQRQL